MPLLVITYRFTFGDGRQETFVIRLDPQTIEPVELLPADLPNWTRLAFHQCSHCPLDPNVHAHCPLAARMVGIVDRFTEIISYEEIHVEVDTPERKVSKQTTAQIGLGALMGLVMATSGCPMTELFKPMAAFHLPMASSDETTYRAASMYLLAQYFLFKETGKADLSLQGLEDFYRSIEVLNMHMANRVRAAVAHDAAINAIVELDFFAKNFTFGLEDRLKELRHLFEPYMDRFKNKISNE